MRTFGILALALALGLPVQAGAQGRDQIRIVGSSTVFPFATAVAEQFGKTTDFKTPVIESTGSGGGLKLFCAGVGMQHPDVTNSSRRIKASEIELCNSNGVLDIVEVKIGFDGIVIANSKATGRYSLTKEQVFRALAKDVPNAAGKLVPNGYTTWSEIDASLPNTRIEVLGPPPTSGTRDAFVELAMEGGAKAIPSLKALRKQDKKAFKAVAHAIREDGAYVEAGENDNLIVQKLEANPKALGIFGFSFLQQNADKIQGSLVGGSKPTFENIASGEYGISRSLYFYVKAAHIDRVPGIREYVGEFTSDRAVGPDGYLGDKGLIPLPDSDRAAVRDAAENLVSIQLADLAAN
ncbi:MAG: substrate-binding domain-containing protein [Proteobacteria bacterium]|nr:substrate-binding domain-containing protein [Pseudomonadota bacterium]